MDKFEELMESIEKFNRIVGDNFEKAYYHSQEARKQFPLIGDNEAVELILYHTIRVLTVLLASYKKVYGQAEFNELHKNLWELYDKLFAKAQEEIWKVEEQEKNKT